MRPLHAALLLLASTAPVSAQGWVPGPDLPDAPTPRIGAAALTYGGQVLVFGGTPLEQPKNEEGQVHGMTPGASSWVSHENLEGGMTRLGVGEDALGRLIVFRGVDAVDPEGDVGQVYAYDLIQGKQGLVGQPSAQAAEDRFAFATDDQQRIYLIGGIDQGGFVPTSRVERYSAATDSWTVLASLPTPVYGAAAVSDGQGHVLLIGGRTSGSSFTANVARYDIATDTWSDTAIPDLPVATADLAAAVGADGRVYAIVGRGAAGGKLSAASDGRWPPWLDDGDRLVRAGLQSRHHCRFRYRRQRRDRTRVDPRPCRQFRHMRRRFRGLLCPLLRGRFRSRRGRSPL